MDKEEYKVGDQLVCIAGFDTSEAKGGAGYIEGAVFTVGRISSSLDPERIIYWPKEGTHANTNGVYGRACKKTDQVVNNYSIY